MAKLMRNILLLAKIQPTANTDSTPTGPLNAILARGIAPQPVVSEFVDRNLMRPYFGNMGKVLAGQYSSIEFEVEIAGAGTAGTAPKYGPLLRACAFGETITAGVSVAYAPITNSQEMVTIYAYVDGVLHKMTDCKGSVSFELNAQEIPVMRFTFLGFSVPVTDATNPTNADYAGFIAPLAINRQNTPTFSLHSTAIRATSLSLDMANQVDYRNYIGAEDVTLTDRKPVGSATFEYDSMAVKNWWTTIGQGTLSTLSLIHGTTAGNIVQFAAPRVQVTSPNISDDNGIAMLGVGLELQPNTGNDELVITVR